MRRVRVRGRSAARGGVRVGGGGGGRGRHLPGYRRGRLLRRERNVLKGRRRLTSSGQRLGRHLREHRHRGRGCGGAHGGACGGEGSGSGAVVGAPAWGSMPKGVVLVAWGMGMGAVMGTEEEAEPGMDTEPPGIVDPGCCSTLREFGWRTEPGGGIGHQLPSGGIIGSVRPAAAAACAAAACAAAAELCRARYEGGYRSCASA